ncbi:MAG TPA: kynureninase [Candidatus Sulfotelmatobacter sp.]
MSTTTYRLGKEFARQMDAQDPLAQLRQRFHIPKTNTGADCVYLCGHSLGLEPKHAALYVEQELRDWADLGVEGHFAGKNPWFTYHRLLTQQTAELVGAEPSEVIVMNSLTANLHLMMVSFYRPTADRHKILVEGGAFPSDQYAVKSQIRFHGFDPSSSLMELRLRTDEACLREEDIHTVIEREGKSIALILLGGVSYVTGQALDLAAVTEAGHKKGCIVGFDLAHAAGNIPLRLHDWGVDFAVWCNYKYLNGGPGCAGGCFVHQRHARAWDVPRFAGWWGHDEKTRFQMGPEFDPMEGAQGWQLSNPPILALAPLRASLDIFSEAGMERLRAKSVALTGYAEFLLRERPSKFSILTPAEPGQRGAQLSLRVPQQGRSICDKLAGQGIIGDWREPNIFRIAPVPLYNSFYDVFRFVEHFSSRLI